MTHVVKTIAFLLFALSTAFAQQTPSQTFKDLLKRGKMKFEMPSLYQIIPTYDNPHMNYELALEYPMMEMEVRYAIRPLDSYLKEYKAFKKRNNPSEQMVEPNALYQSLFIATVANISGEFPEYQEFPPTAVKNEFNADWGATAFVSVRPEFGQKYKYCLVVAIHKDNVGEAYIFFMANDNEVISNHLMTAFHSLSFK